MQELRPRPKHAQELVSSCLKLTSTLKGQVRYKVPTSSMTLGLDFWLFLGHSEISMVLIGEWKGSPIIIDRSGFELRRRHGSGSGKLAF